MRVSRDQAGFTMIEVMVAAVLLAIGLVGILGMQTTAALANRRAADLRVGMELTETAMERLRRDAMGWVGDATVIPSNSWLGTAFAPASIDRWVLPPTEAGNQPFFNDLMLREASNGDIPSGFDFFVEKNSRYCVQYRASWVLPDQLARIEVRSIWPSNVSGEQILAGTCDSLTGLSEDTLGISFEWVQASTMLRWNQIGAIPTTARDT